MSRRVLWELDEAYLLMIVTTGSFAYPTTTEAHTLRMLPFAAWYGRRKK